MCYATTICYAMLGGPARRGSFTRSFALLHPTHVKRCALTTVLCLWQAVRNELKLCLAKSVVFVHACVYHPLTVVSHGRDELGLFSCLFCAIVLVMVVRSRGCSALLWCYETSSRPLQTAY